MKYWTERSDIPCKVLLKWAKLPNSKYHTWLKRYGKANEHNGKIPRDWWLEDWKKKAMLDFHDKHPLEGYPGGSRGSHLDREIQKASKSQKRYMTNIRLRRSCGPVSQWLHHLPQLGDAGRTCKAPR